MRCVNCDKPLVIRRTESVRRFLIRQSCGSKCWGAYVSKSGRTYNQGGLYKNYLERLEREK